MKMTAENLLKFKTMCLRVKFLHFANTVDYFASVIDILNRAKNSYLLLFDVGISVR